MEKRIKDRYNQTILRQIMGRYRIAPDQIRPLPGFESFIYEFEQSGRAYILRIGHSLRRSVSLIQAEVDWINYLAAGGASVAKAIPSRQGNLVEPVSDGQGQHFLATAFVKARGKPSRTAGWNARLFKTYGRLLGKMHALTKDYQPANPAWQRLHWDDALMLEVSELLPASEALALEKYQALMAHLAALPKDKETYGLIHQDAHGGNFFVDEAGTITLFDFDDCAYSWFMNDIAIVLFYAAMGQADIVSFTREFMAHFLQGYRCENRLDPGWLQEIPYFLKLREIDLYAVIHRSFDVNNLNDPWVANYMRHRKERIDYDVPYIDFDFGSLAEYL